MTEKTMVVREIGIDYGHTLQNHFDFCSQIHGHRATVEAYVLGPIQQEEGSSKGMVMDFHFLKKALMEKVHDRLDHEFAVCENNKSDLEFIEGRNENPLVLDKPPTAENLARWAYQEVAKEIPEECDLVKIVWHETPNNRAIYNGLVSEVGHPDVEGE
jgi:6-pyruvoyltetrahydropterin/6-carboxytetrahydropterin synthase